MTPTPRQQAWAAASDQAARAGNEVAAGFFGLIAQPNEQERGKGCCIQYDLRGFRTKHGRRGIRCAICKDVKRWIDPLQEGES